MTWKNKEVNDDARRMINELSSNPPSFLRYSPPGCDTAHHSRIERRRFKRSQLGFRPDYGKRCRRPAARQSRDMDSPARSGAYAASLRDTNSVNSRTRFV